MKKKMPNEADRQITFDTHIIGPELQYVVPQEQIIPAQDTHYRTLIELAQDAIFIVSRGGRIEYVNNCTATLFGRSAMDLTGAQLEEVVSGEDFHHFKERLDRVVASGKPLTFEDSYSLGGRSLWLHTRLIPMENNSAEVFYVLGVARDITDKKNIEASLLESEEIYRTLVETSPDAVTITDLDGTIIKVSRRTLGMYAFGVDGDMLGRHVLELVAPECREAAASSLKRTIGEGTAANLEYIFLRRDGSKFTGELSAAVLKDAQGKPKALILITRDISERKKTERALQESEKRFKELWDNAPVAYHTVDTRGNITRVNHTEANMLGYTVDEMLGKPVFNFILPEQREDAQLRFGQKISDQTISRSENRSYVRRDGSKIYVNIDDVLERDTEGNISGVRTTMVDITDRKRAEDELKYSLEKLRMTMESIVHAMAKIVEMKDPYTAGHQRRVAQLACAIASDMGLPKDQIDGIYMSSVIHDIGKIYVPAEILSKPGRLTEIEFGMIKIHPKVSYDILKMVEFPWPIAKVVLQHHERIDGSGYPLGLTAEDITIEAKILSIADVVEAIAFHRPYRQAVGIDKALEEIYNNSGTIYDPTAAETCLKLFKTDGFKFE